MHLARHILVAATCCACGLDDLSAQWSANDAASASDGRVVTGADATADVSLSTDAGPTLIENSGFENAGSGCGPWKLSYSGTAVSDQPGHESGTCCRICSTDDGTKLGLYAPGPEPPQPGNYRLSGWFRMVSGTAASFNMHVDYYVDSAWKGDISVSGPTSTDWTKLETTGKILANQTSARLYVDVGEVPRDTCVQIDDLRLDPL